MKSSKRVICQAVALVVTAMGASVAIAATPSLIGGGSSLVAPLIAEEVVNFPVADGTARYFQANSTTGQAAFLTNDASLYGITGTVHFGSSDAALLPFQIIQYAAGLGSTDGPLIQIPYVITPITIPLTNAPTGTSKPLPLDPAATPTVALNDDDLCGIFSGKLTDWNQVINPDNNTLYTSVSKPIHVVYDSGGSGTTDLLTRHLHAVCTTFNTAYWNATFLETQNFASNFPAGVPATFHGVSGSSAVAAELITLRGTTTISAVGYLSPAYTNKFLATSTLAPAATNNLSVASLRNSNLNLGTGNANDMVPTASNASAAIATFLAPTTLADAADPTKWVPGTEAANPAVGYPITGTTNIILSQCYANPAPATTPSPAAAVLDFLTLHYGSANAATIAGNGFATVQATLATAITGNFLSNTSGHRLNIGGLLGCLGLGKTGR